MSGYALPCRSWERTQFRSSGLVTTSEEAEQRHFVGSPTVLIDGKDPFADRALPVGLSCRLYRTPTGSSEAPTLEQLIEALRS